MVVDGQAVELTYLAASAEGGAFYLFLFLILHVAGCQRWLTFNGWDSNGSFNPCVGPSWLRAGSFLAADSRMHERGAAEDTFTEALAEQCRFLPTADQ